MSSHCPRLRPCNKRASRHSDCSSTLNNSTSSSNRQMRAGMRGGKRMQAMRIGWRTMQPPLTVHQAPHHVAAHSLARSLDLTITTTTDTLWRSVCAVCPIRPLFLSQLPHIRCRIHTMRTTTAAPLMWHPPVPTLVPARPCIHPTLASVRSEREKKASFPRAIQPRPSVAHLRATRPSCRRCRVCRTAACHRCRRACRRLRASTSAVSTRLPSHCATTIRCAASRSVRRRTLVPPLLSTAVMSCWVMALHSTRTAAMRCARHRCRPYACLCHVIPVPSIPRRPVLPPPLPPPLCCPACHVTTPTVETTTVALQHTYTRPLDRMKMKRSSR